MRIGVLGPLQVEVAGRPVDVGGPLPRRLLAALVAHAGEAVSIDALVDAVWGEDPPRSAVKTLQSYVTRLRIALDTGRSGRPGHGEPHVIVTAPPGYRLVVPPEAVDAHVFVDLIRQAGRAVDQGAIPEADRLLTAAFTLWRGPPYGEFSDLDVGVAEARRLAEVRLAGLETRLDVGLLTGCHAEVVAEAEALCSAYPLRERFWAQLMIALYRSGRQADALAAFQRVRVRLAEEIGADPGSGLRALEQQILRQDPALDAPSAVATEPADVIRRGGSQAGRPATPVEIAPERRVATVLVAAIGPGWADPGWADPERADALQERFREVCVEAVTATGGVVIEQNDDGVTAAFGALAAYDDHATRALHAALAVRARYHGRGDVVSVGVASGEVLRRSGPLGVNVRGEPLRLAAALRHAAGPGEILVGERAVTMTQQAFELTALTDRAAGGGRPLPAAVLVAARPQPRTRARAGPGRAFVGRSDELDALEATYRRALEQGRPHLVRVLGEPGIGKSTVVEHFVDRLREMAPAPVVYTGRCLAYGQGITYGPLADILRAHLGLEPDAAVDRTRERLTGREILGLTLGLDAAGGLDPRDARELLHTAWVTLADELVAVSPAVLVLEDLHWAQQPLLDLVAELVTDVGGTMLVVATARPEYAEAHPTDLGPRRRQQTIWLDRLTEQQADIMLKELLGEPPDDALRRSVLRPAEGNPFFIEELLASLLDRGLLTATAGRLRLDADAAALPVPDTVRSALAARIDCLGPDARATLQAASVAGRVFAAASVARLVEPLRPDLDELVDRDFIRRERSRQPRFTFKHALTRQVAYDLLPAARRARLHAAFADVLLEAATDAGAGDLDERAPLLAHHYGEAARTDVADLAWAGESDTLARVRGQATTWLARAGELALHRAALDEALALLHRALDLSPPATTRAALWRLIARTHEERFDYRAFQAAMSRCIEACDDPQQQAEVYASMVKAVTDWGVVSSAMPDDETVEYWLERALSLAAPGTAAHALALINRAAWFPEHLAEQAPRALAAAEQGGDLETRGQAYGMQECLASIERRHADGLAWAMKRIASIPPDDPYAAGDCYIHPIPALLALGRFAEAREYAARNDAVATKLSFAWAAHAVAWWVEIEALACEWSRVRGYEERAHRPVGSDMSRRVSTIRALLLCAAARAHLGDADESVRLERLAGELAHGHDDRIAAPYIRIALARHDPARVAELMAVAPRRLKPWAQWWALDLAVTRLDALTALGDGASVEEEAAPLLGGSAFLDAVARRALGSVRRDAGLRRQAVEAFARMGLPAQVAQTDARADPL